MFLFLLLQLVIVNRLSAASALSSVTSQITLSTSASITPKFVYMLSIQTVITRRADLAICRSEKVGNSAVSETECKVSSVKYEY